MPATRRSAKASPEAAAASQHDEAAVRVLKKYPNRRLYDTQSSSYITLADVKQMVMGGESFVVRDAKTGEDLTPLFRQRYASFNPDFEPLTRRMVY